MMWVCWRGHAHTEHEFRAYCAKHRRCGRLVPNVKGQLCPGGHECRGKLRPMTAAQEAAYLLGGGEAAVGWIVIKTTLGS